jgi:hypothetical protein
VFVTTGKPITNIPDEPETGDVTTTEAPETNE